MPDPTPFLRDLLTFAVDLARTAEQEIMPRFQSVPVDYKPDGTEVTLADQEAERVMRAHITKHYPDHAILGEEHGMRDSDSRFQWVLDPIDGTTWFGLGVPTFGTLVALLDDGAPVIGVVHLPVTSETVYAARGEGCWLTRRDEPPQPVRADASVQTLADAFISSSGVHGSTIQPVAGRPAYNLTPIIQGARKFRFCGDCLQHALVAQGRLHAAIDTIMEPWDAAALVPCIQEAGGVVSTLDGDQDDIVFGGSVLSAATPQLHDALLNSLHV